MPTGTTWQWVRDNVTGAIRNHALSSEIYRAAMDEVVFMDKTRPEPGFGKNLGESVTLRRMKRMAESTDITLSETIRIPEQGFDFSSTDIIPKEIGRAVPFTSLAKDFHTFDLGSEIQRALKDNLTLGLDTMAAKPFKQAKLKYAPTGLSSYNLATNGVFGATATENLNAYHVRKIGDLLYDSYSCPPYAGADYVGIARRLGVRGILDDPAYERVAVYADPTGMMNGELGRFESIRWMETNHEKALGLVGTGSVCSEAVVFGDGSVAMAEIMTPDITFAMGDPANANRDKSALFYGVLEFGLIWDTANRGEARIMHVGSL